MNTEQILDRIYGHAQLALWKMNGECVSDMSAYRALKDIIELTRQTPTALPGKYEKY